jgi:hypothetical protein
MLRELMAEIKFVAPPADLDLSHRVRHDPLSKLPYDILYSIFPYLDKNSIFGLTEASWHVFASTRNNAFWHQIIRQEILPWFWELEPILTEGFPDDFDCKGFFMWLDRVTKGENANETPLRGIANRRRIWHVCGQIAEVYESKRLAQFELEDEEDFEEAKSIFDSATSSHMAVVAYPVPLIGLRPISKQLVRSWDEIDQNSSTFEAFFNEHGALVGLAVTFGEMRRVFGRAESADLGITSRATIIPAGDWIRELLVWVTDLDLFYKNKQQKEDTLVTYIAGISVSILLLWGWKTLTAP